MSNGRNKQLFTYSVKYICGYFEPIPNVFHWTEINVHNPSKQEPARVSKKFLVSGTQEKPLAESTIESLKLPPNGAFEIDCDEIYTKLGIPISLSRKGFVEFESDKPLSVVAIYDKCTKQPRTDVFMQSEAEVTVEFDLDLDGVFELEADMMLVGPTAIKKSHQKLNASFDRFYIDTEIVSMELDLVEVLGARTYDKELETNRDIPVEELPFDLTGLRIIQSPVFSSRGKIHGPLDGDLQPILPVNSFFDVFVEVQPPADLRQLAGELYNSEAVLMTAKLTQVEPPDQPDDDGNNVYQTPRPAIPLISTATGQVIARIKAHKHTPNPPLTQKPKPTHHKKVLCEDSSIDVEYIEPVLKPIPRHSLILVVSVVIVVVLIILLAILIILN